MNKNRVIEMINECLAEPTYFDKEWIQAMLWIKDLIHSNDKLLKSYEQLLEESNKRTETCNWLEAQVTKMMNQQMVK